MTLASGAKPFATPLYRGKKGEEIRRLQAYLSTGGIIYPEKLITGYFGPLTEAAVKRFQKKYRIPMVGVVGPLTRAELNKLILENRRP